ncbi:hypothetical protein [Tumebacillus algifaecis]|uniref:hypothetical protein n=1 Tax=Tumebacillus algifaecis TaxID=1214604 RepID=UPI0012FD952B|nr:hypothetical protein [Tumebacillus algifaecis]
MNTSNSLLVIVLLAAIGSVIFMMSLVFPMSIYTWLLVLDIVAILWVAVYELRKKFRK